MNQEIKYTGFSAVPSDYECQDGSLAVSINLLPEDGALKPVLAPSEAMQLDEGEVVMFIHKTVTFTHYIIYNKEKSTMYWRDKDGDSSVEIGFIYQLKHCNAIGNTLLGFSESGIYHYFWKDSAYTSLGNHVPNVAVSFGLVGRPMLFSQADESKSSFKITFSSISAGAINNEFSEDNKTSITEQVMSKVNKFVAQETVNKGRFCFPFFVRYALRLYDGSLIHHSAPILMNPSTKNCPVVYWKRVSGKNSYTEAEMDIMLVASTLDYQVLVEEDYNSLSDWKDIVKSVDVFISKPIYTFDQNGKCSSFADTDNFDTVFIGKLKGSSSSFGTRDEPKPVGNFVSKDFMNYYTEWSYAQLYEMYFNESRNHPATTLRMPEFSDKKVRETLESTSTFYKLCSIDIDTLKSNKDNRTEIVVDDEYLRSLVNREVMTDDYLTHDQLCADYSFVYNARLNLSSIKRKLYSGFTSRAMFAFCNAHMSYTRKDTTLNIKPQTRLGDYDITVYIRENGEVYPVQVSENGDFNGKALIWFCSEEVTDGNGNKSMSRPSWGTYVFYPNSNAFKMLIRNYGGNMAYIIDLKPHDFLNGAYALLDYDVERTNNYKDLIETTHSPYDYVSVPNKIYTSEVNNPFYFPVLGINTVGTGEIKGICSAAKALSQGQFGQFPLYAFTTEGVWALEVSSTGTYSAKQPITRDVCINPDGITQLDSAVLFPTDRGIMLISGSQTQCISEAINSEYPFDALLLPGFDKLHTMLGHEPATDKCLPTLPFTEFLKQCRMLYDYVHQRVIVYAPGITYAYVFSLKTNQWGMMFSNITSHLNSYPDALAMDTKNAVLNFSVPITDTVKGLYVTRPLKLEAANVLKTITSVIQRGLFLKGNVSTALYGSRNLHSWHLVWSSKDHNLQGFRGSPYKYYRIAGVATLSPNENVYGASIEFTPRQTNKPR